MEARIRALPKVELHQHVDGSIPAEVTWELMRHYRLHPVETLEEMRTRLELQPEEEGTLLAYLDKMHYPLWITQFYENIAKVTEAIVMVRTSVTVTQGRQPNQLRKIVSEFRKGAVLEIILRRFYVHAFEGATHKMAP